MAAHASQAPHPEAPAMEWPDPPLVPAKVLDNLRDAVALARAYYASDNVGAAVILGGTSDPRGCMSVLAAIIQALLLHVATTERANPEPLLNQISRLLADSALDVAAEQTPAASLPTTPLMRDQRTGAG